MLQFYLASALLVLLALVFLLWPLMFEAKDELSKRTSALKAALDDLKRERADGALSDADFNREREKLSEKLLAAMDAPLKPAKNSAALFAAFGLLALVPATIMLLYTKVGKPQALSFEARVADLRSDSSASNSPNSSNESQVGSAGQAASAEPAAAPGVDLEKAAVGLSARLADNPEDGQGWLLLGRTYLELEKPAEAAKALAEAVKRLPPDAEMLAQLGESIGLAARPSPPPPEAEQRIDEALKVDPKNQRALWLKGIFRRLAGDQTAALAAWTRLQGLLDPSTSIATSLAEQITQLRAESGSPQPIAPAPAAPTASTQIIAAPAADAPVNEPVAAFKPLTVVIDISPELRAKLAPNDPLFVYAKADQGPPMPLATQRLAAIDLPMTVTLDDSHAMMPEMKLSMFGKIIVGARVSKTGVANAAAGDFQGTSLVLSQPVNAPIKIMIDEIRQ